MEYTTQYTESFSPYNEFGIRGAGEIIQATDHDTKDPQAESQESQDSTDCGSPSEWWVITD